MLPGREEHLECSMDACWFKREPDLCSKMNVTRGGGVWLKTSESGERRGTEAEGRAAEPLAKHKAHGSKACSGPWL